MDNTGQRIIRQVHNLKLEEYAFKAELQELQKATGINCSMAKPTLEVVGLLKQISQDVDVMAVIKNLRAADIDVRLSIQTRVAADGVYLSDSATFETLRTFLLCI